VLGFSVLWGNRASGASCRVAGYSFSPLGKSGTLALWQGQWGVLHVLWGGKPPGAKNSKVWGLRFAWVCGAGSWHWVAGWGFPWGSRSWAWIVCAHEAVEGLGPTCIGAWASRSHGSCCRCGRLRLACWHSATWSQSNCWSCGGTKPSDSRNIGACFLGVGSRRVMQSCCKHWGTQYVNGKMRKETCWNYSRNGGEGHKEEYWGRGEFKYNIIVRTFVNVTMYPQCKSNKKEMK
jgi:hypothetical protein